MIITFKRLRHLIPFFILTVFCISSAVFSSANLYALGEPPDFDTQGRSRFGFLNQNVNNSDLPVSQRGTTDKKETSRPDPVNKTQKKTEPDLSEKLTQANEPVPVNMGGFTLAEVADAKTVTDSYEDLASPQSDDEKRNALRRNRLIQLKQFNAAYELYKAVPEQQLSPNEISLVKKLKLFEFIASESSKNVNMFGKSDYLELTDKKTVARLYKSAQYQFIEGNNELVSDLLIQALYIDRNHQLSRNLFKHGLNKPPGTYKIENLERKYWKSSLTNLYSGYPERALSDLMVLSQFDPENPLVFERMGSAYYSMGDPENAVESWQRALYLNPDNPDLKGFIEKAKVEVDRQDKIVSDILSKKHNHKVVVTKDDKIRVLGVYRDSNEAFSFAQEVREELNTPHVMVNERNDGKWEVRLIEKKEVTE